MKRFSKRLYDQNDQVTKQFVIRQLPLILGSSLYLCENGDKYGIDLVGFVAVSATKQLEGESDSPTALGEPADFLFIGVEVEHKLDPSWVDEYPYPDLRIPYRKLKFFAARPLVYFVVVNHDFTRLALVRSEDIPLVPVVSDTIYTKKEKFFSIPCELVRFYKVEEEKEELDSGCHQEAGSFT
jgi:hypothetical protein